MNAIKEAMLAKGYVDSKKRLREVAEEAWKNSGGTTEGARNALFKGMGRDFGLLWELVARSRDYEADALMANIAQEQRTKQEQINKMNPPRAIKVVSSASGHVISDNHPLSARRAADSSSGGAGHIDGGNQAFPAQPIWKESWDRPAPSGTGQARQTASVPRQSPPDQKRFLAAFEATSKTVSRSLLDTFMIGVRPLRDVTVEEAYNEGGKRTREGRFLRLITTTLINHYPHSRIGDFINDGEATEYMKQAEAETADA